jgi:hypothetical protein
MSGGALTFPPAAVEMSGGDDDDDDDDDDDVPVLWEWLLSVDATSEKISSHIDISAFVQKIRQSKHKFRDFTCLTFTHC